MEGGFSFDGIDIATLGLEYAPDNQNTYVYKPSTYSPSEEVFEAHDGGYFYGMTVKPKDFILRCIFQQSHVTHGGFTRLFHVFSRGKTGRLIFKKRPWCWYVATVMSVDVSQMTNYMNGIVTINMRAYYPFARTDKTYITDEDSEIYIEPGGSTWEEDLVWNSAMLKGAEWDLSRNFAETPITSQQTILLYNAGTEKAPVAIEIAGSVGEGVTINNRTTGQSCEVVALNTSNNDYLIIDSLSGKVMMVSSGNVTPGFLYHDNGFIELESGYPANRNIHVTGQQNTNILALSEPVGGQEMIGKYVSLYVVGNSAIFGVSVLGSMNLNMDSTEQYIQQEIVNVSDDGLQLTIGSNLVSAVDMDTQIVSLNEIIVTPKSDMNLTKLIFRYQPTFA